MSKKLQQLEEDVQNRKNELELFDGLIEYLRTRDDEKDPNPEFRAQEDYGFISDVIALLLPLHPRLIRHLPENYNLKNDLSKYVRENCNLPFTNPTDYTNDKCVENLVKLLNEKQAQYVTKTKELEELNCAERGDGIHNVKN